MASHALNPGKVSAFYDIQSDMGRLSHGLFRKTIAARWPELDILAKSPECREMLLDLVDQNIERLNEKIEEYKARLRRQGRTGGHPPQIRPEPHRQANARAPLQMLERVPPRVREI